MYDEFGRNLKLDFGLRVSFFFLENLSCKVVKASKPKKIFAESFLRGLHAFA